MALGATAVAALKPLKIEGPNFVDDGGNKFQIVGAAYQPGGSAGYNPKSGSDPLSHKDACLRDAAIMQVLGINAIRVYNLDPDINHDECASIFNAVSIPSPFSGVPPAARGLPAKRAGMPSKTVHSMLTKSPRPACT